MINIQGNSDEYLLSIPPAQKERAKAIPGRRWDPERKVWKFKRTSEAYDALIAEFGDDLSEITITRPDSNNDSTTKPNPKWPHFPQPKNTKPSDETPASDVGNTNQSLLSKIAGYEKELEELRGKVRELEVARDPSSVEGFIAFAVATANGNKQLKAIIDQNVFGDSHFDSRLPIVLAGELERHLRSKLNVADPTLKLHDILGLAKDADLLSGDNIDLAHIIRKQRNFFAHQGIEQRTKVMRILFTICAASLLWPHITN